MNMPAWLEGAGPGTLGACLGKIASPRKTGLFMRQLCRSHSEVFADLRSLAALDAADQHEAGEIDEGFTGRLTPAVRRLGASCRSAL